MSFEVLVKKTGICFWRELILYERSDFYKSVLFTMLDGNNLKKKNLTCRPINVKLYVANPARALEEV